MQKKSYVIKDFITEIINLTSLFEQNMDIIISLISKTLKLTFP